MLPIRGRRIVCTAFFALLMPSAALAQDPGTVLGTVTDATSGRPLTGVQVSVEGTTHGGLSDESGRFTLTGIPAGTYRLRADFIGYATRVTTIEVVTGATVTSDFRLSPSAVALDAVLVTVTGERRRRELGNAVATIEADKVLDVAPVHSMSDLLQGRTGGVQLMRSSGATGMGSRVRIRGASSISLSNEPLVYVDGVRAETSSAFTVWAGGQSPSRLDDLNPEDVESIEIVKGPAAATLYGTEAANGVIRITTRRGRPGAPRWSAWSEVGVVQDPNSYPLNYAGLDENGGFFAQRCLLDFEARGRCTQTGLRSYQVLNDPALSPVADGRRQQHGLSVQGGSEQMRFYLSAELESERGPLELPGPYRDTLLTRSVTVEERVEHPQRLDRVNVRANLDARVRPNTTVQVSTGYVSSDLSIVPNDNDSNGVIWSALAGGTNPNDPASAWGFLTPAESFGQEVSQTVERFTSSALLRSKPRPWLDLRATVGLDYSNRRDVRFTPRDLGVPGQANLGQRQSNAFSNYRYTLDAIATARRDLSSTVRSETSVGVQFFRTRFQGTLASGEDLVPGAASIGAAAQTSSSEQSGEDKTAGVFVQQTFDVADRLFVTAALRADDNSAFGRDFDLIYYPKAGVSWVASDESFFPDLPFLDQLRLRAAWGRSGLQPGSTAALTTLDAFPVTNGADETTSGVRIGEVGNNLLEPELSTELEAGLDADLLGGRVGVELTFYRKTTSGALVRAPVAPSLGSSATQWVNIGDVLNRGLEAAVRATPLETEKIRWDLSLSGSTNHNELLTLGEDIARIGEGGANFVPGYPLGGSWNLPILDYGDEDGNGIITADELVVSDTLQYLGPTMPRRELSASSTVTLLSRLRLYALLEHRGDFYQANATEWFRCQLRRCRALSDRTVSMAEQARAVAAVYHPSQSTGGFSEDASFVKLREVSVTYTVPEVWLSRLGVDRLSVTLAGRNLKTWSDYSGLDPEVNFSGQSNFGQNDFLTQPPSRYWTLRINVGF